MSDMDELDEKIAEAIHKAQMGVLGMSPAKAVRAAIESAGFVLMPKDQILRKMSHEEFTEMVERIRFRENADG